MDNKKLSIVVISCNSYHCLTNITFKFIKENVNKELGLKVYYINDTIKTKEQGINNILTGKIMIQKNNKHVDSFVSRLLKGLQNLDTEYIFLIEDDHWYDKKFLNIDVMKNIVDTLYKFDLDQIKLTPVSFGTLDSSILKDHPNGFEIKLDSDNDCLLENENITIRWAHGTKYPVSHHSTIFKKTI